MRTGSTRRRRSTGVYQPLVGDFAGRPGRRHPLVRARRGGRRAVDRRTPGPAGSDSFTRVRFSVDGDYRPVVGDFVGDDYDDILWYRPGTDAGPDLGVGRRPDAVFERVDRLTVDGDYRPEVLRDYRDGAHKDRVVWQRTSKGHDAVWRFDGDGLGGLPLRACRDPHRRGGAGRRLGRRRPRRPPAVRAGHGGRRPLAERVRGRLQPSTTSRSTACYQPVTVIGAERDGVFLFGPGAAADRYLRSEGTSFTSAAGRLVPDRRRGLRRRRPRVRLRAQHHDRHPRGRVHRRKPVAGRRFKLSESHDIGAGIRPVTGDFDDDGVVDILWYGPGRAPTSSGTPSRSTRVSPARTGGRCRLGR